MPDLAVASSNRMEAGALPCCTCANSEEESSNIKNSFTLVSSCALGVGSGQVRRVGGFEQDLWNGVFRGGLGTGMASDADALLAASHPEIAGLAFHAFARTIE